MPEYFNHRLPLVLQTLKMNLIPFRLYDRSPGPKQIVVLASKNLDLVVSLIEFLGLTRARSED